MVRKTEGREVTRREREKAMMILNVMLLTHILPKVWETSQKSLNALSYFSFISFVYWSLCRGSGSYSSKFRVSAGPRRCGTIGPCTLRWYMASQSMSLNQGCALMAEAPPLMLPRRFDTSTVQSCEMMSRASVDMAEGKRSLPSTILDSC
jgi:hypothetical protein